MTPSIKFFKKFFTNPYKRRICSKSRTFILRYNPDLRLLLYSKHGSLFYFYLK
jgi:hypothetical protein